MRLPLSDSWVKKSAIWAMPHKTRAKSNDPIETGNETKKRKMKSNNAKTTSKDRPHKKSS